MTNLIVGQERVDPAKDIIIPILGMVFSLMNRNRNQREYVASTVTSFKKASAFSAQ
jgi:hypothetical protein